MMMNFINNASRLFYVDTIIGYMLLIIHTIWYIFPCFVCWVEAETLACISMAQGRQLFFDLISLYFLIHLHLQFSRVYLRL